MKNENNGIEHLESACLAVRQASRAVTQFYNRMMAPSGLNVSQFICLQAIDRGHEIAQCDLARSHTLSVETLSRRLSSLKTRGLVTVRLGNTRRERIYRLTPEGKLLLAKAEPFWISAQSRLWATLGEHKWDELFVVTGSLLDAVAILSTKPFRSQHRISTSRISR